jgi:hypothetical protein
VGLRTKDLWFNTWQGKEIFLFSEISMFALKPAQPLVELVTDVLFLVVKHSGHESDNSSPSHTEVRKGGAKPALPCMPSWCA